MKIACIGAGGRYFIRPLGDVAVSEELHGSEIVLYDIDRERAEMMAGVARRFSDHAGAGLTVRCADQLADAVEGASFVLASIGGVGGAGALGYQQSPIHINDCLISARHGVYQIVGDTAGPAAMAAAFRSVPIYLNICREMEKRAPEAIMLNHANPMAVLCRAMNKYTSVRCVIGICHGVQAGIQYVAEVLKVQPQELDTVWIGTNHYYWFTRLCHRGKDVMDEFWRRIRARLPERQHEMCRELSEIYGYWLTYPSDDHAVEFYPFLAQVRDQDHLPYGMGEYGHGRDLMPYYAGQKTIEELRKQDLALSRKEMLRGYAEELDGAELPEASTDPVTGEGTARLMADIAQGRRAVHVLNIPNRGAVPNLPRHALMEVEAVTDSCGVRPLAMGEAPPVLEAMLRKRIAWHEHVVDAAVKGDRRLALQAMMLDEQAIPPDRAPALLEELLQNSKGMLPQFGLGE